MLQSDGIAGAPGQVIAHGALYTQSIGGCMDTAIGRHGLSQFLLDRYLQRVIPQLAQLKDNYQTGRLAFLTIPEDTADLVEMAAAFNRLSQGAEVIVFFGTGGSSLGGQTLAQLGGWNIPGAGSKGSGSRPRTRFYDNFDPATLADVLANIDLATARFVVTSKSGGTVETLSQAIATLTAVKAAGLADRIPELFLGITEPDKPGKLNGLRALFAAYNIPTLEHHTGIGGRFSCLTNVGLMAALARGLDPYAIRAGARSVVEALLAAEHPRDFAPAVGAAVAVALSKEKGIRTVVMMPYADRLGRMADWFVQLWAESLGKNGEGTTPVPALGPVDQHSQLQLFMEGARELYITLIRVDMAGSGPVIDPGMAKLAGLDFVAGRTVGDVVEAQSHAIADALAQSGRPARTVDLASLNEHAMGALLMHFMIETVLAGRVLGIDPFDQPGVELAKTLTRERLLQPG